MASALVDAAGGRAVIVDGEMTYILESHDQVPKDGRGMNIRMYLQGGGEIEEKDDVGEHPFNELFKSLVESEAGHSAFRWFLFCMDGTLPVDLRQDLAKEVEKNILANPKIKEFILGRLLETPLPPAANFEDLPETGHVGEIIAAVKKKWRP